MKNIIMGLFIVLNLHALTYEELLKQALKNNSQLQIVKNQAQKVALEGQISTRMENPNLELEVANFEEQVRQRRHDVGNTIGLSQSLLLPWVKSDKQALSHRQVELEEENYKLEKSLFLYGFNLRYLAYKEAKQKELLGEKSLILAQRVLTITKERFEQGGIAKHELIQAQISKRQALNNGKSLSLATLKTKNRLLLFSNVNKDFSLDEQHQFLELNSGTSHPLLGISEKKEAIAKASLKVASHSLENIEFFSELEAEPNQDIFRVGVSIPLPVFNNKSEEKQLAKLELQNQRLAFATQQKAINLEIPQLKNEINIQQEQQVNDEALLSEQQKLLEMYQEGYAIAKVNLLKLNTLKEELIKTEERLLETSLLIEKNNIKINYLQGAYNE